MERKIKLLAFDLDGTLARSKMAMEPAMASKLEELLDVCDVAIITGGRLEQISKQVLSKLGADSRSSGLHLMPTCGGAYYRVLKDERDERSVVEVYSLEIEESLRGGIKADLERYARELGFWVDNSFGDVIEDRVTQITYSGLGQSAPVELKEGWDPDNRKKERLRDLIAERYPNLSVKSGGATSIDVTLKGVDKAYAIKELLSRNKLNVNEVLYLGDRFDEKGNDYPVLSTGVSVRAVKGWEESLEVVDSFLRDNLKF